METEGMQRPADTRNNGFSVYNGGLSPNDVFGVAINWFVNRCPLVSRLPKLPAGSTHAGATQAPIAATQYCQTVQHAYRIDDPHDYEDVGLGLPLDRDRMLAAQHVMDDFESACYYGKGVGTKGAASRFLMKGVQSILATNNTTAPTNAAAYKPSDLVRDTIQACFNGGGNQNLLIVSTDFLSAFAVWGHAAMRVNAGKNVFGTPIDLFEAPFLSGISIIPAPLLRPGTAICLSSHEARIRLKRSMIDKPKDGSGGLEGDIIMEGAIEIDNEQHHAFVSGVQAFSAT
jgi:Family of unknown function (DUF5309)